MVPFYMRHVTCLIVKIVQIRVPSIFFYSILGGQNHETIVGIGHVMWCSWRAISYPTPHKFILPLNWWLRCAIWGKWRTNFGKNWGLGRTENRFAMRLGIPSEIPTFIFHCADAASVPWQWAKVRRMTATQEVRVQGQVYVPRSKKRREEENEKADNSQIHHCSSKSKRHITHSNIVCRDYSCSRNSAP